MKVDEYYQQPKDILGEPGAMQPIHLPDGGLRQDNSAQVANGNASGSRQSADLGRPRSSSNQASTERNPKQQRLPHSKIDQRLQRANAMDGEPPNAAIIDDTVIERANSLHSPASL